MTASKIKWNVRSFIIGTKHYLQNVWLVNASTIVHRLSSLRKIIWLIISCLSRAIYSHSHTERMCTNMCSLHILKQLPNWILPGEANNYNAQVVRSALIHGSHGFNEMLTSVRFLQKINYFVHANGMKERTINRFHLTRREMVIDFQDLLLFRNC